MEGRVISKKEGLGCEWQDGGKERTETGWEEKLKFIINLCFHCLNFGCILQTKAKLELLPDERKFEFSEMYIFGKFDTFCRRLKKIIDIFETMEMYSHLQDTKIEGSFKAFFEIVVAHMRIF